MKNKAYNQFRWGVGFRSEISSGIGSGLRCKMKSNKGKVHRKMLEQVWDCVCTQVDLLTLDQVWLYTKDRVALQVVDTLMDKLTW